MTLSGQQHYPVQTEDIFVRLRAETAELHSALESLEISKAIVSPSVSINDYARYLRKMLAVNRDFENHIFPLLSTVLPDIEQRKKSRWIENDLVRLGETTPQISPLPITASHPRIDVPFALGMMYVLEGSTMGGRYILNNISSVEKIAVTGAQQYFSGYRENTGRFWTTLKAVIKTNAISENDNKQIIAGAVMTFNCIYQYLKGTAVLNEH
jgi:heme oxygenase (biliverdin-IX-beta and delta-forming)